MNIGLQWLAKADVNNYTSNTGLKLRRVINPLLRRIVKLTAKRKIVTVSYPELDKKQAYIFASSHYFDEDVTSALSVIDRNAYYFSGTEEQLKYNPEYYFAWLNGMIHVTLTSKWSREQSLKKMVATINRGTSVLIYPEGSWNDTENMLVQPLFPGIYKVAKETGAQIVPIASFRSNEEQIIYVTVGNPISAENREKQDVLTEVRNQIATFLWNSMEQHTTMVKRTSLPPDPRNHHLEVRKAEYMTEPWKHDVWEEEIAFCNDKEHPYPFYIRQELEKVTVTHKNAWIMAPILARIEEDHKYNFKEYMHKHWND